MNMPEPIKSMKPASSQTQGLVSPPDGNSGRPGSWLQVGAIAAASAVLGGLAAAWFYRHTLSKLREAEHDIPESRIIEDASPEDF